MRRHGRVVGSPVRALARRVSAGMCLAVAAGLAAAASAGAAPNAWTAVGSLATGRVQSAVAVLQSGKVLIAGGSGGSGDSLASSEIYDPATRAWSAGGALPAGRTQAAAVTLQNGQVLVVGGETDGAPADPTPRSALLYDPTSDSFTPTIGTMSDGRADAGIALLPNGDAIVIGGYDPATGLDLSTTEIYDPSTDAFTAGPSMNDPRESPTITTLADGDILVAGGADFNDNEAALDTAEVLDSHANTWSDTADMSTARRGGGTALLPDGRVLVTGGADADGNIVSTTDIYDPNTRAFSAGAAMAQPRAGFGIAPLANGDVLVAGGLGATPNSTSSTAGLTSTEIYDATAGTWSPGGDLPAASILPAMVRLPNGEVLEAGGSADLQTVSTQAAVFGPAAAPTTPTTTTTFSTTPATTTTATTTTATTPTTPTTTTLPGRSLPAPDQAARLQLSRLATRMTLKQFLKGLHFTVTPSKAVTLQVTLTGATTRRVSSRLTLAGARFELAAAARKVRLKPARKLIGHTKSMKAQLTIVAIDAAGTRSLVTRTLTIKG